MSNTQDVDDPLLPVDINNRSVVANSNLEGLNGTEAGQVPSRIHCNRPELPGYSVSDRLVQLPELFRSEFRELNPERQPLIPRSSGVRAGRFSPREFAGETRRCPQSSSRSDVPPRRGRSRTGRTRTSRGIPAA